MALRLILPRRYYNGTTRVEFTPYGGDAANETGCSNIRDKKFTFDFDSILAITERDEYNLGNNPVNTFLILWPLNGRLYLDSKLTDVADDQWSLLSSMLVSFSLPKLLSSLTVIIQARLHRHSGLLC